MSCKRIPKMDRHQSKRNSVMPAKAGIQGCGRGATSGPTSAWIPFFNDMTDTVRHLDSRFHGNDGSAKRRLLAVIGAPRFPLDASWVCGRIS